jgi:hypothetical protein
MSWDLQDVGAHLREKHGYQGSLAMSLPMNLGERLLQHDKDHADPIGLGHEHDPNDPRILKEV